jgi:hypothetical protein
MAPPATQKIAFGRISGAMDRHKYGGSACCRVSDMRFEDALGRRGAMDA